jgi:LuxR family transcriptional regulator, maltose regulon positive regulatory protein
MQRIVECFTPALCYLLYPNLHGSSRYPMSAVPRLVPTKLYAPPPRPDEIRRERLTARLDAGLRRGHWLFLCSAPAGYGKTTLLSTWLYEGGLPFTWLSLDQRDNDLRTFGRYLVAALQRLQPATGMQLNSLLAVPESPTPEALAEALLHDLTAITEPFVLVLDDLHELTAPEVHTFLTVVMEYPAPQLRLVLSTRVDPPFPLGRLRAGGRLSEIRAADLRFTADEAQSFFAQTMGLTLRREDVQFLDQRTEGWVAGLQLAALSMQGMAEAEVAAFVTGFRGSHHYIIGYLAEEVLRLQVPDVRDFLRHTVMLHQFCPALCDAITGRDDSRAMLARLERANLFVVPLDAERVWYRYHHLFADVVRAELALEPAQRSALHIRAAEWFAAQGRMHDAIDHALYAEAWELAGRWMLRVADAAIAAFDYELVNGWLDRLPAAVVTAEPELLLLRALFAYLALPPNAGQAALAALDGIASAHLSARSWGRLQHIRATNAMLHEAPEAVALLQEALELISTDDLFFRQRTIVALGRAYRLAGQTTAARNAFAEARTLGARLPGPANTLHANHLLALIDLDQARRREVMALCAAQLDADPQRVLHPLPTNDLLCVPLAICAYEANDLDQALERARRGRAEYRRYGLQNRGLIAADQILILTYAARDDWDAAWHTFSELERLPTTNRWVVPQLALLAADLRLRLGQIVAAEQWLTSVAPNASGLPVEIGEAYACTAARVFLAQGRAAEAQQQLTGLDLQVRAADRFARLITVHLLQALTHAALGQTEPARTALHAALTIAAPEGYLRRFLDEGPVVARLLPLGATLAPAFIDDIQQAFAAESSAGTPAASATALQRLPNGLTQQERRILGLLADGASYRAIAAELVISVGTVRWHIHNIYGKLGVANRTQSLNRARELGLL